MKPMRTMLLAAAALTLASAAAAQQVYKSVDADGHVVYSDRGASRNSPTTSLKVQESDAAGAAQLARQQRELEAADAARRQEQAADDKQRAAQAKQHQQACDKARQEYDRVLNTRRPYHLDGDGNRIYYSDAELEQMRERARQAMATACGN
jgi:Skp family chaperone for outer membrane proteins